LTAGETGSGKLLILGLGNVICGDDGVGVVAVDRLAREYELPQGVEALDGGTLGLALLHYAAGADDLLLVDAIRADNPPGTLVRLSGDDVAPAVRERLSVHQIGVADLLEGLRLLDAYPRRVLLLGLVPESLELRVGLSPAVDAGLPGLVSEVAREVRRLGYPLRLRDAHATVLPRGDDRAYRALGL
jgi:hydrogenase maturation protease